MTEVDWLIVAFTALLAMYGYAQGFIVGALSLLGFGLGAFLGSHLAPLVLPQGSHSQYAPLFALLGALLAGAVLASGLQGLGARARMLLRFPGLRLVDGVFGAILTSVVALGIAWIIGAVASQSAGSPVLRSDIQRSAILRELNGLLPPSGPLLNALARIDPLPSVRGPEADVPPPTRGILATRGVKAAGRSVVKVLGTACGLGIEGSGWVAAPGIVVTNAHVVAGETDTTVQVGGNAPGARCGRDRLRPPRRHRGAARARAPAAGAEDGRATRRRAPPRGSSGIRSTGRSTSSPAVSVRPRP